MKSFGVLALAASSAMAAPPSLDSRQFGSSTRTDLEDGNASACPGSILIFARATGESGNIVSYPTPICVEPH